LRYAIAGQPVAHPFAVLGKQPRSGIGVEELMVVT
jgi:hypothetical protein